MVDIFGRRIKMIFECVIPLFSLNISKEKIDQVISVPLRKLAKKNIAVFWSDSVKTKLIQETLATKKRKIFNIVYEASLDSVFSLSLIYINNGDVLLEFW